MSHKFFSLKSNLWRRWASPRTSYNGRRGHSVWGTASHQGVPLEFLSWVPYKLFGIRFGAKNTTQRPRGAQQHDDGPRIPPDHPSISTVQEKDVSSPPRNSHTVNVRFPSCGVCGQVLEVNVREVEEHVATSTFPHIQPLEVSHCDNRNIFHTNATLT